MSKLFVKMKLAIIEGGDALDSFAKVSGVSASQFKEAFEKDATKALLMFLKGLDNINKTGGSAIETLEDMDFTEVRLRDTILRAASAHDKFGEALGLANQGWKENTALQKEADQRYKTTASQMQIAKNKVVDLGISLGENLLPKVNTVLTAFGGLVDKLGKMSPEFQSFIGWTALTVAAIGPVVLGVGKAIKIFVALKAALGAAGAFASKVFKKDIKEAGDSSTTTAGQYKNAADTMVRETAKIKSSFSGLGNSFSTQATTLL